MYRDLSGARCTAIKAKYLNDKIDAKSIAMAMIMEGSKFSVQKLVEFILCRATIGRGGGEHVFLCWTKAYWDEFFNTPDFDWWSVIKTNNVKCALLFGDRNLYILLVPFAFLGCSCSCCLEDSVETTTTKNIKVLSS